MLLRQFLSPELGVYCAILVMNLATPLLDRVIRPVRFGVSD
jgi:Na+-translocating ferredoxin:NAD+ oxidoreductase RnfD subunit